MDKAPMNAQLRTASDRPVLNVLLVEDDFTTRRHLIGKLSSAAGLRIEVAASVSEAIDQIGRCSFDVILVDLGLPDGSGIKIIDAAVQQVPAPQVLVLSAMRDEASVVAAIMAGAGGYIVKDASVDDIVTAVYDLSAGLSPLSPSIARFILRSFRSREQAPDPTAEAAVADHNQFDPGQFGLTAREHAVLLQITRGATYKQIARSLSIAEATVQSHIKNIYRKLGVSNRSEASYRFTLSG